MTSTYFAARKSPTIKDLNKVWTALPGKHSAKTTLLLDDSPDKIRLQPYNHVCISEYSVHARDHDFELKRSGLLKSVEQVTVASPKLPSKDLSLEETTQEPESAMETLDALTHASSSQPPAKDALSPTPPLNSAPSPATVIKEKVGANASSASPDHSQLKTSLPSHGDAPAHSLASSYLYSTPSIKLSLPAQSKLLQSTTGTEQATNVEDADAWHTKRTTTDETLLAIIGILDALKNESNVAGWIRAGALWAGHIPRSEAAHPAALAEAPEVRSSSNADTDLLTTFGRPPSPTDLEVEDLLLEHSPAGSSSMSPIPSHENNSEAQPESTESPKRQRSQESSALGDGVSGSPKRTRTGIDTYIPSSLSESSATGNDYREGAESVQRTASTESTKPRDEKPFIIPGFRFTNGASNALPSDTNGAIPAGNDAETFGAQERTSSPRVDDEFEIPGLNFFNRSTSSFDSNGHPAQTTPLLPSSSPAPEALSARPGTHQQLWTPAPKHMKMWYEDPEAFSHWVQRGREALRSMGIEEEEGVDFV